MTGEVVAIGEGMLELSRGDRESWSLRTGGDTLNVAIYLARAGERVAYLSALGDDVHSSRMRDEWTGEGLDTSLILTRPGRLPGLYAIETDDRGERSFHYWRDSSAARAMFECDGIQAALERAAQADLVYLSGITLSLYGEKERGRLAAVCRSVRARGGDVAFDPNYRARGWRSPGAARAAIAELAPSISIVLPTFEDEALLYGESSPEHCVSRWRTVGVREVVIKLGPKGAIVSCGDLLEKLETQENPHPVDTTGAGDAFNAAYLRARRENKTVTAAAEQGNALASVVISHRGAIVSRSVTTFQT